MKSVMSSSRGVLFRPLLADARFNLTSSSSSSSRAVDLCARPLTSSTHPALTRWSRYSHPVHPSYLHSQRHTSSFPRHSQSQFAVFIFPCSSLHPFSRFTSSVSSSSAPPSPSASSSPPTSAHPHGLPSSPATSIHSQPIPPAPSSSTTIPLSSTVPPPTSPLPSPPNESQLRRLFRQYGAVAVGTYLTIYVGTLGMLYIAVKERWVGGVDVVHWMEWLGWGGMEEVDPRKGDFAVAWIATKFTEPIRLGITAGLTPTIARWLGRAPPKEGGGGGTSLVKRVKETVEKVKEEGEQVKAAVTSSLTEKSSPSTVAASSDVSTASASAPSSSTPGGSSEKPQSQRRTE